MNCTLQGDTIIIIAHPCGVVVSSSDGGEDGGLAGLASVSCHNEMLFKVAVSVVHLQTLVVTH